MVSRAAARRAGGPAGLEVIAAAIRTLLDARGPRPLCTACLCDHLGLKASQVARAVARMARRGTVERAVRRCSGCCTCRRVVGRGNSQHPWSDRAQPC
jgi:hypothetical protein